MFKVRKYFNKNGEVKISEYFFNDLGTALDYYTKERRNLEKRNINDYITTFGEHYNTYQAFECYDYEKNCLKNLLEEITIEEA